jgi:hypothetical protein
MIAKSWAIKLATEAARTVLSVDQIIVARQAGGPKPPGPNPVSSFGFNSLNTTNCFRTGMRIRCIEKEVSACTIIPKCAHAVFFFNVTRINIKTLGLKNETVVLFNAIS